MLCRPTVSEARRSLDLRLAESYVPCGVIWIKTMMYTCLVPAYLFSGPSLHVPVVSCFLVVLYYDRTYLNHCQNVVDTTAVAVDVVAACVAALVVDLEQCWICQFVSAVWFVGGCAHILLHRADTPRALPACVTHIACAVFLVALLGSAAPSSHTGSNAITESIACFARSAAYAILVAVDVYLLQSQGDSEQERAHILRYGHVLFTHLQLACAFAAVTLLSQVVRVYTQAPQASLPNCVLAHAAPPCATVNPHQHPQTTMLLTPAQLVRGAGTPTLRNPSPKPMGEWPQALPTKPPNNDAVASMDVLEVFRLAKQQYTQSKVAKSLD